MEGTGGNINHQKSFYGISTSILTGQTRQIGQT